MDPLLSKKIKEVIPDGFLLRNTTLQCHALKKCHGKTSFLWILNKYKQYNRKVEILKKFLRGGRQDDPENPKIEKEVLQMSQEW